MGTVIIWPVATMPTQGVWLECNGQSTAGYPELAAVVGANVPNYQGIFLRGYGSQVSAHYGTVTHSSATLGELQGDTIRNITGTVGVTGPYVTGSGAFYSAGAGLWGGQTMGTNYTYIDVSRVVPTAVENRPVNKAVRYLMKAA